LNDNVTFLLFEFGLFEGSCLSYYFHMCRLWIF